MNSILQNDKVDKNVIHPTKNYFIIYNYFCDIEIALKDMVINEDICRGFSLWVMILIYRIEYTDVKAVIYNKTFLLFFKNFFKNYFLKNYLFKLKLKKRIITKKSGLPQYLGLLILNRCLKRKQ